MRVEQIPVVDFRDYLSADPRRRADFTASLGEALERLGFIAVTGHGISPELIEQGYDVAREVFALSEATKRNYERADDGHQRGYTPFGLEHAKDEAAPDLKEFWHVGPALGNLDPALAAALPQNLYPAEVPAFEPLFRELFETFDRFARHLLAAIAVYLEQPVDVFSSMVEGGNSVLRIINYPDLGHSVPKGAVRAAAHEDINILTVLPASTKPGLELLTRDGRWVAVQTPPGVMICDTGDMMSLVSGRRLPATTHRVVNPEAADGGRMSMPFFLHPHPEHVLTPIKDVGEAPIRTKDYLYERLRSTGVA